MKNLFNKLTSTVAAAIVVFIGAVMAGLGLTVVAVLAMFALAVLGLAVIAAPFVKLPGQPDQDIDASFTDEDLQTA